MFHTKNWTVSINYVSLPKLLHEEIIIAPNPVFKSVLSRSCLFQNRRQGRERKNVSGRSLFRWMGQNGPTYCYCHAASRSLLQNPLRVSGKWKFELYGLAYRSRLAASRSIPQTLLGFQVILNLNYMAKLTSLAMLLLDPHYRTLSGFCVEKFLNKMALLTAIAMLLLHPYYRTLSGFQVNLNLNYMA